MTITSLTAARAGDVTTATAVSDLSGTVYFHWYLDGAWVGRTTTGVRTFHLPPGEQVRLEVLDTTSDSFDAVANAPAGWPARRTLWWTRPPTEDLARFVVEQQADGGDWAVIGTVWVVAGAWSYSLLTPRLADLADYAWRVTPYDLAGNAGTPIALPAERVVRTPDAPGFAVELDPDTQRVTFSEAS